MSTPPHPYRPYLEITPTTPSRLNGRIVIVDDSPPNQVVYRLMAYPPGSIMMAITDEGMPDLNPPVNPSSVVSILTAEEAAVIGGALMTLAGSLPPSPPGSLLDLPIADLLARRMEYLRSLPYSEYLQTPHWQACRARAIERAKGACQVCSATERLQVHHRTYDRFGDESDDDLTVLCEPCHEVFHQHRKLVRPT